MTAFDKYEAEKAREGEIARDRWGRPMIKPAGKKKAVPYTRVTTVASTLDNRRALEKWLQRQVAIGLARSPGLYADLQVAGDDRDKVEAICERAHEVAGSQSGASLGTMLHHATYLLDQGYEPSVLEEFKPHLEAYQRLTEGWEYLWLEQMVVLDEHKVAGTPDRIMMFEGRPTVVDLKTGKSLDYSWRAIAVQLAAYAHADDVYFADGRREAIDARKDVGIVVHLPVDDPDSAALYTVDLETGWEAFDWSMRVRKWQSGNASHLWDRLDWRAKAKARVESRPAWEQLAEEIKRIGEHPEARKALLAAWPPATGKPSADMTAEQVAVLTAIVNQVQADHGLPF